MFLHFADKNDIVRKSVWFLLIEGRPCLLRHILERNSFGENGGQAR